jgi:hypothetical protein
MTTIMLSMMTFFAFKPKDLPQRINWVLSAGFSDFVAGLQGAPNMVSPSVNVDQLATHNHPEPWTVWYP